MRTFWHLGSSGFLLLWVLVSLKACGLASPGGSSRTLPAPPRLNRLVSELGLFNFKNSCFLNALLNALALPSLFPFLTGKVPGAPLPEDAFGKAWVEFLMAHVGSYERVTRFYFNQPALLNALVLEAQGESRPARRIRPEIYPQGYKQVLLEVLVKALQTKDAGTGLAQKLLKQQQYDVLEAFEDLRGYGLPLVPFFQQGTFSKLLEDPLPAADRGRPNFEELRLRAEQGAFPVLLQIENSVGGTKKNGQTVQECLLEYLTPEEVLEPSQFLFSTKFPGKKLPFKRRFLFASGVPSSAVKQAKPFPFLVLALKRFAHEEVTDPVTGVKTFEEVKLRHPVDFLGPLTLPVLAATLDEIQEKGVWKNEALARELVELSVEGPGVRPKQWQTQTLRLRSIIIHDGEEVHKGDKGGGGGHYVALVHHPDAAASQDLSKGFWTYRDDANPMKIEAKKFKDSEPYKKALTDGYLFVYEALP